MKGPLGRVATILRWKSNAQVAMLLCLLALLFILDVNAELQTRGDGGLCLRNCRLYGITWYGTLQVRLYSYMVRRTIENMFWKCKCIFWGQNIGFISIYQLSSIRFSRILSIGIGIGLNRYYRYRYCIVLSVWLAPTIDVIGINIGLNRYYRYSYWYRIGLLVCLGQTIDIIDMPSSNNLYYRITPNQTDTHPYITDNTHPIPEFIEDQKLRGLHLA